MHLAPGEATAWHRHSAVDDYFVCLKGKIRVEIRGEELPAPLEPGETARVAVGLTHRVSNSAGGASQYLLVQGVGPYDFLREE